MTKIHTILKSGLSHPVYGEDALWVQQTGDWIMAAVMDGCSSGKESHWAAGLYKKILQKTGLILPPLGKIDPDMDMDRMSPEEIGQYFLSELFDQLKQTKKQLLLDPIELLSTLVFFVYNTKSREAWINVSGDGYFAVNGQITEIDQNNTPDFLGYHFNLNPNQWMSEHTETFTFQEVREIAIATDGIDSFFSPVTRKPANINTASLFLTETSEADQEDLLEPIFNRLVQDEKIAPYDDIAVVRVLSAE